MAVALFGGAFDPPHNGHVALVRAAKNRFGLPLIVLVSEHPGHKAVDLPAEVRLELARGFVEGHGECCDFVTAGIGQPC